ncbi:MAG TPA: inorganic diphosphatase [Labilithrix sp.]|jgi:inorganic pyrophosphatase
MADFPNLPCHDENGSVLVVVEAPRGSIVKLKYEPKLGVFLFHRALQLGLAYPYDWGFIPSTRAEDGDPLDAMVLFDAPTWPGVVIPSRALGVVRLVQREGKGSKTRNDRIIAVPADDERYEDVSDLPKSQRQQLETFFASVGRLAGKEVEIEGWDKAAKASRVIEKAVRAYVDRGEGS